MAVIFSSVLTDIAAALATCLVVAYFYFSHVYSYWKKRGVHYIQPTWFVGNLGGVALQKEHLGEYLKKLYDDYPDEPVVGLFTGTTPMLMVKDLELVRRVLVKDAHAFLDRSIEASQEGDPLFSKSLFVLKGKRWRHMRIKLTPTFTSGKIKMMFHLINKCGKALLPCLDKEIEEAGSCVAVKEVVARYSTDVIASCAFGVDANALADPSSEFRATMRKIFERTSLRVFICRLLLFAPWLVKLLGLKTFDEDINTFVRRTFWDVVEHRKKNKLVRKDFVDILIQMKDEGEVRAEDERDVEEIKEDSKYMNVDNSKYDKLDIKLDSDDIVAQAFFFIAAGFETSSSAVTFTLYELAMNNDIQDRLRNEIMTVLDKHNSQITYDAITEMPYLEMVISETMRKYPALPLLERKCVKDYKIPGLDLTVEQGTSVVIPLLGIHMDSTVYPDPEKFDPERFTPENKSKRPNFTYIPFGEGPRICIGMRFGQVGVKTALVNILSHYKVKRCAQTPLAPLGMRPGSGGVNMPRKNIIVEFEKIK